MTPTQSLQFSKTFQSLSINLPNPPGKYSLESVINYYSSFTIADDFCLERLQKMVLKIILKLRYLKLLVETGFLDNFYKMLLRFYQGLYVKSITYQYLMEFSLMLAKL